MGRIFIRVGHRVLVIELTANGKVSSRFYKYSNDMPQKLHTQYLNLTRFEKDAQRKMLISCARGAVACFLIN